MQTFRKIYSAVAGVLLLFILAGNECKADSMVVYTNLDTGFSVYMEDEANLLTGEEENALKESMVPITEYGNVTFLSKKSSEVGDTAEYAKRYNNDKFGRKSSVVFFVDLWNREIYIFSNGEIYESVTDSKAAVIADNVYSYASDDDYYTCAAKAYEQIYKVLKGQAIAQPMKYIGNGIFALMIALVVNFFIARGNSKSKKVGDSILASSALKHFEANNFEVKYLHTSKKYNPRSSDSGGSGGGSSGGDGGGGGGGGHSF